MFIYYSKRIPTQNYQSLLMLSNRKDIYERYKDDKEALKKQRYPTPADYKEEFPWLKEVDSLALANAQMNLNAAYESSQTSRKGS